MSSNSFLVSDGYGPLVAPTAVEPPIRSAMIKHPDSASGKIWSTDGGRSTCSKLEVPTAFTHVRLHVYSDRAFTGGTMAVAPTSNGDNSTADSTHKPHNALGVIDESLWQTGTLTDITSEMVDNPENYYEQPNLVTSISEWFEVESIPDADSKQYVLLRMTTPNGGHTQVGYTNSTPTAMQQWQGADGEIYHRMFVASGFDPSVIDATDFNTYPAGALSGGGGYCHLFAVEFGIAEESNAVSMLMLGDSISVATINPVQAFNTWAEVAFARAMTAAGRPWFFTNGGMAGRSEGFISTAPMSKAWGYGNHYDDIANQGAQFDWVWCPAFTPNGSDPYEDGREQEQLDWLDWIVARTAAEGSNLILWEGIPNQGYAEASDVVRRRINSYAETLASENDHVWYILQGSEVTVPDQLPARMIAEYNQDTFHLNTLANTEAMEPFAQAKMTEIILDVSPPSANAGADANAEAGQPFALDSSASTQGDAAIASRVWTQVSGSETVTIANANAATTSATAPLISGPEAYTFRVTLTDVNGLSNYDEVTFTIADSTAPALTFDEPSIVWTQGTAWIEPGGYTATDLVDGDVTGDVVAGTPDVSAIGEQQVPYTVEDSAGNSKTGYRTVNVVGQSELDSLLERMARVSVWDFKGDRNYTAYKGRANREVFQWEPSENLSFQLDDDGNFDFTKSGITKIEIFAGALADNIKISSETNSVLVDGSKVYARMGDLNIPTNKQRSQPVTVIAYPEGDTMGVVLTTSESPGGTMSLNTYVV